MKPLLSTLLLLISFLGKAQNLIMNPSFEEYYECPTGFSQIKKCKNVFNPWCTAGGSTQNCFVHQPNYFNSCADISSGLNVPYIYNSMYNNNIVYSYREAKDGNAFISIRNDIIINPVTGQTQGSVREYVQIKLTTPLIAGKKYDFSFYTGSADNSPNWNIQINQLGVHFTNDSILYSNTSMPIWKLLDADWVSNEYITDSIGWQKLSGSYLANGGEKWMIVGIFTTAEEFSYNQIYYHENVPIQDKYSTTYLDDFYMEEKIQQPPVPTITTNPATCTENGSASISNYDTLNTYAFSPSGPTVDNNGNISGMLPGTSYTVTTNDGTNDSDPSDAFTIEAQIPAAPAPTVTSPQSFCGATLTSDLVPSTSEYKWHTTIGGETLLNPNDTLYSGTYYVSHLNGNCESEKATVEVIIHPIPSLTVSPNASICEGETVLLTVMGANSYIWSPTNETNNSISVSPTSTTTYTVIGTTDGCSDSAVVTVTVFNHPVASFTTISDTVYVPSQVNFTNTSSNATSYSWFLDSVYQTSSTHFTTNISQEGTYSITLIATNGVCPSDTTSKTMYSILLPPFVNPPNVFSPNNDGVNDNWVFEGTIKSVIILNRWGNVVFSADKDFNGWNGKDKMGNACSDGVYFYQIVDDKGMVHTSFITLLR